MNLSKNGDHFLFKENGNLDLRYDFEKHKPSLPQKVMETIFYKE